MSELLSESTNNISEWDELEARSLISTERHGPMDKLTPRRNNGFRWRHVQIVILLALCAVVTIFKEDLMALVIIEKEVEIIGKIPVEELRTLVLEGKKDFDAMLKEDYGEYAEDIFDTVSVMSYFKSLSDLSRQRLKRRMKMKIIESQVTEGTTSFTWAIGGHSAAAGHGNLFNQATGAIIEQSLKPVFGALGIKFYGKNYAMGGTKSGPEVAMCMESIFGNDVDIISWDFGMTDGRSMERYNLWAQRAGMLPSRPTLFAFGCRHCASAHSQVEAAGGAAFDSDFAKARSILPDSNDEKVDVSKLSRGVKYYMCSGHVETGEPCKDHKWDTVDTCDKMRAQTSWHNGHFEIQFRVPRKGNLYLSSTVHA